MQNYTANGLYLMYKPDVHLIGIHDVYISHILVHILCDTLLMVYHSLPRYISYTLYLGIHLVCICNTITELSNILNRREKLGYFR